MGKPSYIYPRGLGLLKRVARHVLWDLPHFQDSQGRKRVALTIDDGPSLRFLPVILEVLGSSPWHPKVTFFLLGDRCLLYPELVRRIAEAGHGIALHGDVHWRLWPLGPGDLAQRVTDNLAAIHAALPPSAKVLPYFRPPMGFILPLQSALLRSRFGLQAVNCSILPGQADAANGWIEVPATTAERVKNELVNGSIIALHGGERLTLENLPATEALSDQLRGSPKLLERANNSVYDMDQVKAALTAVLEVIYSSGHYTDVLP